jgi:hypothetical protein
MQEMESIPQSLNNVAHLLERNQIGWLGSQKHYMNASDKAASYSSKTSDLVPALSLMVTGSFLDRRNNLEVSHTPD